MEIVNTTKSSDYILKSSKEYSIYVCENRAIPRVTDGLKDAQRKALWVSRNCSEKTKVMTLVGDLFKIYVHGDQSAASAISLLAAPYCNNVPLLEGIGSFGTRISPVDGIGAARYIYVKRSKAAQEMLYNDLDIIPLKDNYDGSYKEPTTFLPLIPLVLLNGISGIAVGWSTDILPRKLDDIIDSCLNVLNGKPLKRLIPTYSYLKCRTIPVEQNVWEFVGTFERLNTTTIKITELPPDLSLDKFLIRLNKLEEDDVIRGYTDRSTDFIDVDIKFPQGYLANKPDESIIELLKLRNKKTERCVVVDWNGTSIKQYNDINDIITGFVNWRLKWFYTRYEKKKADDSYELIYWKGIKECFNKKLPEKLPKAKDKADVEQNICDITKKLGLDQSQIEKIASLPSYNWAIDYYNKVLNKIEQLETNITEYNDILSSEQKIKDIYKDELKHLKSLKIS
jgi:DNA topoisomerase-2